MSIRQTLDGPYADRELVELDDGDWAYDYYQEGNDPGSRDSDFTNRALMQNIRDGVPIGVVRQVKKKPGSRYRVLGLAKVESWHNGYFRLRRYVADSSDEAINGSALLPLSLEDARRRIERAIVARQGANTFRTAVMIAFGGRCAVTGYDVSDGLEAAHIVPYRGVHTNAVTNGLLLRADLHTLFDRELIKVDADTFEVSVAPELRASSIGELHGRKLRLPDQPERWRDAFQLRYKLSIV